jgi:PadR family transcriptional regulator PadR
MSKDVRQETYQNHFKKGVTTLCILSVLRQEKEVYGYQLVRLIDQRSQGKFILQEGTLYPVLYRLEQQGYIICRKELVGKKMERVYYRLTESGSSYYEKILQEYNEINAGVHLVLSASAKEDIEC